MFIHLDSSILTKNPSRVICDRFDSSLVLVNNTTIRHTTHNTQQLVNNTQHTHNNNNTTGCFYPSMQLSLPVSKTIRPVSMFTQVFKLYWFCCCFIAISILVLPFALTAQFLAVHTVVTQLRFLPLFARLHQLAKGIIYTTVELLKRIPLALIGLVRFKDSAVRRFLFLYSYFYIGCLTCYTLHAQWLVFRTILLSGDIESNPGPETLDFCTWNLNNIIAHNYDLIGIVETHLDSTIDEERLALDGYSFHKDNHPQNVKEVVLDCALRIPFLPKIVQIW